MTHQLRPTNILIADDDCDDRLLAMLAFDATQLEGTLHFVEDGEQLLQYLRREGEYSDPASSPTPGIVLVDLHMPRKGGLEAIADIRGDAALRRLPLVVLTSSDAAADVSDTYELGVNSYITKPDTFDGLVSTMRSLSQYWFDLVELPR